MNYRVNPYGNKERNSLKNKHSFCKIGPIEFNVSDLSLAVQEIKSAIDAKSNKVFAFCNMHTFNIARRSTVLADAMSRATIYNDGIAMDIASRILFGKRFPANLNGTDLTPKVLGSLTKPTSVYIVGSASGVAEKAAQVLSAKFDNIKIVGCQHGFFEDSEDKNITESIRTAGTELLLVGMGNPRQEIWADKIRDEVGAVVLCVGAYIDFEAGKFKRAPYWVRQLRSEWIFRLILEPNRLWKRYLGGAPVFFYAVAMEKIKRRNSIE
jgi:N-acetylglucosaminyldiphosphoundecaprenol N-acetyl-beta-D-mannosaminyltransferase/alpha-1,3-mannosyltransferase